MSLFCMLHSASPRVMRGKVLRLKIPTKRTIHLKDRLIARDILHRYDKVELSEHGHRSVVVRGVHAAQGKVYGLLTSEQSDHVVVVGRCLKPALALEARRRAGKANAGDDVIVSARRRQVIFVHTVIHLGLQAIDRLTQNHGIDEVTCAEIAGFQLCLQRPPCETTLCEERAAIRACYLLLVEPLLIGVSQVQRIAVHVRRHNALTHLPCHRAYA
mmetsp:Transcript_31367/g.90070  ORF Transcript_31367/g.90070 Transcript_31367/m.90070 type:complete len:215 (-) Transcript_31367:196-840(-)